MSDQPVKLLDDKDEFELDDHDEFESQVNETYFRTYEDAKRCSCRFIANFWNVTIDRTLDIQGRDMWIVRAAR